MPRPCLELRTGSGHETSLTPTGVCQHPNEHLCRCFRTPGKVFWNTHWGAMGSWQVKHPKRCIAYTLFLTVWDATIQKDFNSNLISTISPSRESAAGEKLARSFQNQEWSLLPHWDQELAREYLQHYVIQWRTGQSMHQWHPCLLIGMHRLCMFVVMHPSTMLV